MTDQLKLMDVPDARRELSFRNRVIILACIGVFFIFIIVARLVNIQIINFETYSTISNENRFRVKVIAPPRGYFYDRNGEILADTRFVLTLTVDEERVDNLDQTITRLRDIVELTDSHLEEFAKARTSRTRPFRPIPLKRDLSEEEAALVALNRHQLPGVIIATESLRNYPHGELTVHALGAVRRITEEDIPELDTAIYSATDFVGGNGIEKFYEEALHGMPGYRIVEVDAHHREIKVLNETPPIRGNDIFLHLDLDMQKTAWEAIGDRRGAVVAVDTRTGGILALVSKPAYDPNVLLRGISKAEYDAMQDPVATPMFNRAVRAMYAPGSTFKPVMALAGLAYGQTTWDRIIVDQGTFRLKNTPNSRVWRGWSWTRNNPGGQGHCDLNRAIYRSSNIYFYTLAEELGVENIAAFAKQFGFGQNVAFDVPEAAEGILPTPEWKENRIGEIWQPGDTINMGIGQGSMLVTPLQVANLATTIARQGAAIQPRLIMYSPQGFPKGQKPISEPPQIEGPLPEDWEKLREAMVAVVHRGNMGYGNNGTAWAYIGIRVPYEIAGKSGTAQAIAIPEGEEYEEDDVPEIYRDHAWFMAFAPAHEPEIAVVALIENGGAGSQIAGPVVRAMLDAYMRVGESPDNV